MENSDHILHNSFILTSAIVLDYMHLIRNNNNNNYILGLVDNIGNIINKLNDISIGSR